jgi:exodeoxyribonuclease V beta subunit
MSAHYPRPSVLRHIKKGQHAVIEASAGTGKTYAIEHLVVDLLLNERVQLDEILVLTFTERAAAELRRRIQAKIEQILSEPCAQVKCAHDKPHGVWWIDDEARERLNRALFAFDAASIGTIHGFFGRVLAEHAFHSGRLFQSTLEDGLTLFDRAFKNGLRRSLAVRPGDAAELLEIWMREKSPTKTIKELVQLLHDCYRSQSEILPRPSLDALRREGDANPLFQVDRPAVAGTIASALKAAKVHHSTAKAIAKRLENIIERVEESGKGLKTLLNHNFQQTILEICKMLDGRSFADPRLSEIAAGLVRLRESARAPIDAALVQAALPVAAKMLERHKAATGKFDYDDLITGVDRALAGPCAPELIAALRRRYRFALIDEFQDTDKLQWNFFRRVFVESGGPHRVYLVADAKQAIYSFRGADVVAFLDARGHLTQLGSPRVSLSKCFRSTSELIEAYNLIFDSSAQPPFFEGPIKYDTPVRHGRDLVAEQAGANVAPVHLIKVTPRGDSLGISELRRALAQAIARQAKSILEDGPKLHFGSPEKTEPVSPGKVYVLTATNRDAVYVSRALRDQKVPFSFYKQDGLFQTGEARAVRDLLAALDDPADPRRRRRAWITPFFDVPLAALLAQDDLPESNPLVKRLVDWNKLARDRHFETLFSRILDESGIMRRELFLDDNERALTNYLHLFEILLEEARATGCELCDLIATLTAYFQETRKPPGDEADVQRLESDRDSVQIMTIHKSKGLEAAVVFVYGGFTAFRTDGVHAFHGPEHRRTLYIGDDPDAKAAARAEWDQEQQRLFYVALTRAKVRLYLPMVPDEFWSPRWDGGYARVNRRLNELEKTLSPPCFERLFHVINVTDQLGRPARPGRESETELDLALRTPPPGAITEPGDSGVFAGLRTRHAGYEVTSYSRLKRTSDANLVPLGREEFDGGFAQPAATAAAPLPEGALPSGTATGTLLHEVLELVPFESFSDAPDFPSWLRLESVAHVIDDALAHNGFDLKTHRTTAAEMGYRALTVNLPLGNGATIPGLCRCEKYLREMEFLIPYPESSHPPLSDPLPLQLVIERGFIKGYVDLVVEYGGLVYFADWKSDVLESYKPDALRAHVESLYALQAKLYALALVKALDARSKPDYEARFGGLVYVFLRGLEGAIPGNPPIYFNRPDWVELLAIEAEVKRLGCKTRGGSP